MGELLKGLKRTKRCGEFSASDINKKVVVMGWASRVRNHGKINFIDLRDTSGILQVLFDEADVDKETFEKSCRVKNEFVIAAIGTLKARNSSNINKNISTGEIELVGEEIKILSESEVLPFMVDDDDVNEMLRLKHRYIELRGENLHSKIKTRSEVTKIISDYLHKNNFINIETPMLGRSTPEGARDYLVPSRVNKGMFYALPQSPQIYKQLLMVAGFDRYYQIARCFRDEDLRANRQPEFTQIDIEMSFVEAEDIMNVAENMIKELFFKTRGIKFNKPFPRITYKYAMDNYGSDSPDLRFDMKLKDISSVVEKTEQSFLKDAVKNGGNVKLINAKGAAEKFSRRDVDALSVYVRNYKAKGVSSIIIEKDGIKSSLAKFFSDAQIKDIIKIAEAEVGDILFVCADTTAVTNAALGALRVYLARQLGLISNNDFNFCWVTDFPLFEYSEEDKRYYSVHHPFTSPTDEYADNFEKNMDKTLSKSYDLVINGQEAGGGSVRIHDQKIQRRIFKALGFSEQDIETKFGFFANAFKYGTPPHGGLAFGLDRLCMIISGTDSIKDVIAFPKNQSAACVMSDAPNAVDEEQLKELSIKVQLEKKPE